MNETTLDLAEARSEVDLLTHGVGGSAAWFQKLLQLSMTVTATDMDFVGFGLLARDALDTILQREGRVVSDEEWSRVAQALGRLPPHPDVRGGLERLRAAGHKTMALTNSDQASVEGQLARAGITELFDHVVSVERVRAYKPARAPYVEAARIAGKDPSDLWMVACHDWDLAGARAVGLRTAFIERAGMAYSPVYPAPELSVADFEALADRLPRWRG